MKIGDRVRIVTGESIYGLEGEIRDGTDGRGPAAREQGDWLVSVPNEFVEWFFESELEIVK